MTSTALHRIQDERLAGSLAIALSVIGLAFANFAGNGENGGGAEYAIGLALCAIVAAVLFGRVLPRTTSASAAWWLAGLSVLTVVVFWTGLPFIFGVGAMYLSARTDRTAPGVVGAVAVALALVACAIG